MPDKIASRRQVFAALYTSDIESHLSDAAFRLLAFYLAAAQRGEPSWWPIHKIAASLHRSVRAVQDAKHQLLKAGFIAIRKTGRCDLVTVCEREVQNSAPQTGRILHPKQRKRNRPQSSPSNEIDQPAGVAVLPPEVLRRSTIASDGSFVLSDHDTPPWA